MPVTPDRIFDHLAGLDHGFNPLELHTFQAGSLTD
jgi:hypothetical protein